MADGTRPGGLTALAVLNFIGTAGFLLFSVIFLITANTPKLMDFARDEMVKQGRSQEEIEAHDRNAERAKQDLEKMGGPNVAYGIAGGLGFLAILLLISGVGYLKLSPVWGRGMGNVYGLLGVIGVVTLGATAGFNLFIVILLIWWGRDL